MKRFVTVFGAVAALFLSGAAQAADFTLGFEGYPALIKEPVDTPVTFDAYCTLTTSNNESPDGAQGWSIGMAITGGTITAFTVEGIEVSTIFQKDKVPAPPINPYILDLADAGFVVFESFDVPVTCPGSPIGAVSAIVLHQTKKMVLQPTGTQKIAKITVETKVAADPFDLVIKYEDGCVGSGQPVANVVTFAGASVTPVLGTCTVPVRAPGQEFKLALAPEGSVPTAAGDLMLNLKVAPDTEVKLPVIAFLTTEGLPPGDGPQGWSIGIAHQNMSVVADEDVTVCGVEVSTIFQKDKVPAPPLDPYILDLCDAGFVVAEKTVAESPAVGVVSAIVLHQTKKMVLHANAQDPLLKIIYTLPPVALGETKTAAAAFAEGLIGSGQPVANVITYGGGSKSPTGLQAIIITYTGAIEKDNFIRGDANDDLRVDIADAVYIVYSVVPGLDTEGKYGILCKDAGDANADGLLNLADAIYIINHQFLAGPQPAVPFPACGTVETSTKDTCPPDSTKCP